MAAPPTELVEQFRAIATQRLEKLERAWEQVLQTADDASEQTLQRELHTLKGESQILGFTDVNLLCHKLEDLLAAARSRGYAVGEDFDLVVVMAIRFLGMLSRKRVGANLGGVDLPGFVRQIDKTLREVRANPSGGHPRTRTSASLAPLASSEDTVPPALRAKLAIPACDAFIEYATAHGHRRNRLRASWHALRDVIGIRRATLGPDQLAKHRLGGQAVAQALGKALEVELDLPRIEVTSEVLQAIDLAVLHLIRNAVDHGLESPAERAAASKPPTGRITVRARLDGDSVVVSVGDDGRGVDLAKVRSRAIELGLLEANQSLDQGAWVDIVCHPGFSTREQASDISGRGVGLDAVRAAVRALGGKLEAVTATGAGTTWRLTIPTPPLSVRGYVLTIPGIPFPIVLEGWEPSASPSVSAVPLDVGRALGLDLAQSPVGSIATFVRGADSIAIMVSIPPRPVDARRLVATCATGLYDVVVLDSREGLALRPERLLGTQ